MQSNNFPSFICSGLRPLQGSVKEREHKKFIFYSLYAWGGPLVIFAITICMELIPSIPDTYVKPHFGTEKCWFRGQLSFIMRFFYFDVGNKNKIKPLFYWLALNYS